MQKAEVILSLLSKKARNDENFVFRRLYRNLFRSDFYRKAWIDEKQKNNGSFHGNQGDLVDSIIQKVKNETYHPDFFLKNKIPPFADQLVHGAVTQLLEAIYEPRFLETSHGFRPYKSCLTALQALQTTCGGTNWVIQGQIHDFPGQMNHDVMIRLLSKRIEDGRLLELVRRFLKAGYIQEKKLSSLLMNICLHELDRFMQDFPSFPASYPMMKSDGVHVKYIRYADEFLVCIRGSKGLAKEIRESIQLWLRNSLLLELDRKKTMVIHLREQRARFLDYEITTSLCYRNITDKKAHIDGIRLLVPNDMIKKKIKPFSKNGRPVHHKARIHLPLPDLIKLYHTEIRQLYNYYCLAVDVNAKLNKFRYYHYSSLLKTVARKEKSSVRKVLNKYGVSVKGRQGTGFKKLLGWKESSPKGEVKVITYFNDSLKKKDVPDPVQVERP
ncbi:group II intron reverse transcriptase/maturase [Kroppenstedtia pulmonis]|uniref:Group II intron reverse transcriptase/maturase n=1 Tax=Kroppenstedtia pulmonis TaxID=1380685 RepID=A0A7D4BIX2_9BACL|nr:reverse transcriptase/maturase family protein [Kroppenstedtia pulmonis]QKG85815.1 group II intron reverse transcriptase/maturase [Kroppenstedtia pulmonis]